jgi:hypothetical protein
MYWVGVDLPGLTEADLGALLTLGLGCAVFGFFSSLTMKFL